MGAPGLIDGRDPDLDPDDAGESPFDFDPPALRLQADRAWREYQRSCVRVGPGGTSSRTRRRRYQRALDLEKAAAKAAGLFRDPREAA